MAKKKKCKCCGRMFEPKDKDDKFCSMVCRTTGLFVGGGGDTTKPGVSTSSKPEEPPKVAAPRIKAGDERYSRVRDMFNLPPSERYAISKTFTKEEAEYARRIARRQLAEEERLRREISWESDDDSETVVAEDGGGFGEDSDDGTV